MIKRNEKKVEYLELIYDLIFVYMVGRDNALIDNIQNGFIRPSVLLIYFITTLSIIQIWNFTTFYINMFGRNSIRDHSFLLVNMYLMYFLGEATRLDAANYVIQYHIAWGLILVNIGLQYLLELRNHNADAWNKQIIKHMTAALFTEAIIVFISGFLNPIAALIVSGCAIAVGIILTLIGKAVSISVNVDFMHLTERAMLYVVFTFGEMIIALAGYFKGNGSVDVSMIYYSLMSFLIAAGLFFSYEVVYDRLIDREGKFNGLLFMLIHIITLFALNNITVSLEFMREGEIELLPKIIFLSFSIAGYFASLLLLGGHFKEKYHHKTGSILKFILFSSAFILLMVVFRNIMAVNILISALYVFAGFLAFRRFAES